MQPPICLSEIIGCNFWVPVKYRFLIAPIGTSHFIVPHPDFHCLPLIALRGIFTKNRSLPPPLNFRPYWAFSYDLEGYNSCNSHLSSIQWYDLPTKRIPPVPITVTNIESRKHLRKCRNDATEDLQDRPVKTPSSPLLPLLTVRAWWQADTHTHPPPHDRR